MHGLARAVPGSDDRTRFALPAGDAVRTTSRDITPVGWDDVSVYASRAETGSSTAVGYGIGAEPGRALRESKFEALERVLVRAESIPLARSGNRIAVTRPATSEYRPYRLRSIGDDRESPRRSLSVGVASGTDEDDLVRRGAVEFVEKSTVNRFLRGADRDRFRLPDGPSDAVSTVESTSEIYQWLDEAGYDRFVRVATFADLSVALALASRPDTAPTRLVGSAAYPDEAVAVRKAVDELGVMYAGLADDIRRGVVESVPRTDRGARSTREPMDFDVEAHVSGYQSRIRYTEPVWLTAESGSRVGVTRVVVPIEESERDSELLLPPPVGDIERLASRVSVESLSA